MNSKHDKTSDNAISNFQGFDSPNTTPTPDIIFDYLAPQLSEAELRVLLYIVRRTFGFKKNSDTISLSQMINGITTRQGKVLDLGTGMSRQGVMRGIKGLLEKGVITVRKSIADDGVNHINVYSLKLKHQGVVYEVDHGRQRRRLRVGNDVDPQETVVQETDLQTSNSNVDISKDRKRTATTTGFTRLGDRLKNRIKLLDEKGSIQLPSGEAVSQAVEGVELEGGGTIDQLASSTGEAATDALRATGNRTIGRAEQEKINALADEVSQEFGDTRHRRSNRTQMLNIFYSVPTLTVDGLVDVVYRAKGLTKESQVLGTVRSSSMAYFFATLKDKLNLPGGRSPAPT